MKMKLQQGFDGMTEDILDWSEIEKVRSLAEKFQINGICKFIEEYIGGKLWISNM